MVYSFLKTLTFKRYLLLIALICFASTVGMANEKVISLFDRPGQTSPEYDRKLTAIAPGVSLKFSDGNVFQVKKILGNGKTSFVLSVQDSSKSRFAIRIPGGHFAIEPEWSDEPFGLLSDYLDEFVGGNRVYQKAGVPVVQMLSKRGYPKEYVPVEELDIKFTLEDVLSRDSKIPLSEKNRVLGKPLTEFVKRLWQFDEVGDCRPANIGWVNGKWLLIDMTDTFKIYDPRRQGELTARDKKPLLLTVMKDDKNNNDPRIRYELIEEELTSQRDHERAVHHYKPQLSEKDPIVEEVEIRREYRWLRNKKRFPNFLPMPEDERRAKIKVLQSKLKTVILRRCVSDVLDSQLKN